MAVPEQTPYSEHTGNGITTSFALGFQCETKDHLIVLIDDIEPPIATWSLVDGNVVFTAAPASGKKITLQRDTPFSRSSEYQLYNNSFRPSNVNADFDRIWWKLQELGLANWLMKQYVDKKDDELKAYLLEEIRKQGVALDQLDEYYNYLMQRLAQIAVDKGWSADFVVYHGISQKKINDGLESIAELLAIQNPFDNMRIFVKSYRSAIGIGYIGEATPYKGGNWFVYKSSRAAENDGVFIFNGWERFLESDTYTPYMSGCVCDGITDDTLNFDKLMYALEVNNMKGRVFIEDDMFFNNQCPLTGKLQYAMNFGDGLPVIRLVDNVDIEIKSTLKFGGFYNDKAIAVFNAKYNSDANDWLGNKHYNINIYGGGTLDFSQAGNMQTAYRSRICFSLANCTDSSVHNLTIKKGDFMNTIVTNYRGSGVDIHHMTFIDQMDDHSASHDHSTMYLIAENCHVYANQFISSGVKSKLNACAVELHGNNQHMYGNKTILGYRNAVFVAANKLGHEGVDDLYRGDITIKNNSATCLTFFKLWIDTILPIGIIECENNIHKVSNFVTRQDVLDAGVDVSLWDDLPQVAHFFGTETEKTNAYFPDSPSAHIKIHGNDYIGRVSGFDEDFFMYTPVIVRDGLDIQFNNIKSRQLFVLTDFRDYGQQMLMRRFKFLNNDVSWGAIYDRLAISTAPIAFQKCEIDLNVDFNLGTSLTTDSFFWIDVDAANTFNNKFSFKLDRIDQFNKSVGGSLTTQNAEFYLYNKLTYTARVDIQTYSEAEQRAIYLFSNDSRIVNGVSTVELRMLKASGPIPFIYPPALSKDYRSSTARQVAALAYKTDDLAIPTGIYGYAVIST